ACGAHKEQQAGNRQDAKLSQALVRHAGLRRGVKNRVEIERVEGAEQQKHSQHEAEVTNAVDDEGFLPSLRCRMLQVVKPNQQVAAQPHAFPTTEQENVVCCEDQDQHEKHEQIHVRKEAEVTFFMRHVAGGVDVYEEAHAGDDEQH